jgi:hypothetical protein
LYWVHPDRNKHADIHPHRFSESDRDQHFDIHPDAIRNADRNDFGNADRDGDMDQHFGAHADLAPKLPSHGAGGLRPPRRQEPPLARKLPELAMRNAARRR